MPKVSKKPKESDPTGEARAFKDQSAWAEWLEKNHRGSPGVWIRLGKKGSGIKSITSPEALEVALCYGWIDAQMRPENEETWLQRFMPRATRSLWSKRNREKALALIESGKMRPAGLEEIERAKADGRWDEAYDSPKNATVPGDLEDALRKNPRAKAFFKTLNAANRYAILWRLQTAKKPDTRQRRIGTIVAMLEKGGTFH
ncbi:MAG: YdeI family protein [Gemmatimonadaceae bacterium]